MIRVLAFITGAVLLVPSVGYGQGSETVRVIAERAQVRLRADPNSVVLASPVAGTVLEAIKRAGDWVVVNIPTSNAGEPMRVGYVSLSEVEPFSSAAISPSVNRSVATPINALADDDYQQRFNRAKSKRDSGKKKFWWGMALTAGGAVLAIADVESCDIYDVYSSCSATLAQIGSLTALGGGVFQTWGLIQWISGSGDLSELAASRPRAGLNSVTTSKPQFSYSIRW